MRKWLYCVFFLFLLITLVHPRSSEAAGFPIMGVLHTGRVEALAVDSRTHMLYIADEAPGEIIGFDPLGGIVRWRTALGGANDVQVDSRTHWVYATGTPAGSKQEALVILAGASGQILAHLPITSGESSIAIDSQQQHIYVASRDPGTIFNFSIPAGWPGKNMRIHRQVWRGPGFGLHPEAIGINSLLGRLYIADSARQLVNVIDEKQKRTLASIPIAEGPIAPLRVDEASGRVYVLCSLGQELDVIDGNTNKIVARTAVAPYPEGLAVNTATGRVYIANEGDGGPGRQAPGDTISVLDGQTFAMLGTMKVGDEPDGVAADAGLQRVYIALEGGQAVIELSDSLDLPLQSEANTNKTLIAHQALLTLQQATGLVCIVMILTLVGATLGALLRQRRAQESPQIRPAVGWFRSKQRSLRQ